MADKKEKPENITPMPWLYLLVCGVVLLICCGALWFAYDVYAKSGDNSHLKTEVTVLMPAEVDASLSETKDKENQEIILSPKAEQPSEDQKEEEENIPIQAENEPQEKIFYIAIVIDDMGDSQKHTKEILSLQAPLTSSFLTYGQNLKELCEEAKKAGHEIMIHVPMEPEDPDEKAPDMLTVGMSDEEIKQNLTQMLQKFEEIDVKGVNNHMGSLLTTNKEKMDVVMKVLHKQHLFFLDSKTTPHSVAGQSAKDNDVLYFKRDVFLDNKNDYAYISKQLKEAEKIASLQGFSIAIGHPRSETYRVLKDWLENSQNSQIKLVHLSELTAQLNPKK